jgi:WD40 repeat protein
MVAATSIGDRNLNAPDKEPVRLARGADHVETRWMAVATSGSVLATADSRGRVAVWDNEPDWMIERLLDSRTDASSVALSPDGRLLAVGELGAGISVWNVRSHRRLPIAASALRWAKFMAFNHDGSKLAAVSNSNRDIVIWSLARCGEISLLRGQVPFHSVAFSPDGRYLACGEIGDRPSVVVWDVETGKPWRNLQGSEGAVQSVTFSADGRFLATSAAYDRGARIWDIASGVEKLMTSGHTQGTNAVAFAPHANILASVGNDGAARLWDGATGEHRAVLNGQTVRLNHVAFSVDGKFLFATASSDNDIRYWDLAELNRTSDR